MKIGVDDQASDKIKSITGKLGNGLKTAAKVGTAAVGVASTAIVGLTKQAVENYAEYEQLVGGVDTLFKNASQKVQKYAADAYKTAGMSANDYMANATAFSASLISALGGDTEKAAEYANRAMVSMSDNANKMGTSLDSIVQTYQSLSRGNMAMLDNLKLGYGGTKAELERLIKDASTYTDIQKEMGITVDASSMSFDNIVNAIAVVQGKLGIAGATAQEAGTTIEGSVNSMKAAWDNLITGFANGEADLEGLINNFVTTIVGDGTESNLGVLGNIMPALRQALKGAAKVVSKAAPIIAEELPKLMDEILPELVTATVNLIVALSEQIPSMISPLLGAVWQVVDEIEGAFAERIPGLGFVFENLETIIASLTATFITYKSAMAITGIIDSLRKATEAQTLSQVLLNKVMSANPYVLVATLIVGLVTAIVTLWNTNEDFRNALISAWESIKASGEKIFTSLANFFTTTIPNAFNSVIDWFGNIKQRFANIGKNIIDGIRSGISKAWGNLKAWFSNLFGDLIGIAKRILGIASPSKEFEKIGLFADKGLQVGFEGGARDVFKTVEGLAKGLTESFNPDLTADYTVNYNNSGTGRNNSFVQPFGQIDSYGQKTEVVVSIDDNINPLSFARYLLPFLKVAQKEVYG